MVIGALFAAVFTSATIFLTIRRKKLKNDEDKGKYIFNTVMQFDHYAFF